MDSEVRTQSVSPTTSVILAQVLAILLTVMGISVESLSNRGVSLPSTLNCSAYILLSILYVPPFLWRLRQSGARLEGKKWLYGLLAFLDVEANTIVIVAYKFTSMTSVTLLDFAVIPCAMLLTFLFFGVRYRWGHLGGAGLCIAGLSVLVVTDAMSTDVQTGSNPPLGDALVVVSAILYAASNVTEEALLKKARRPEVLAMLPLVALPLSLLQAVLIERDKWGEVYEAGWSAAWGYVSYAFAIVGFYSLAPIVLHVSGSAALNVSMVTSDLWSALARVLFFGGFGGTGMAIAFVVSLLCVVAGLAFYARSGDASAAQAEGGRKKIWASLEDSLDSSGSDTSALSEGDNMGESVGLLEK